MVEYWNVGLDKEVTHFIASLSREILPIYHYSIFLEPIIPSFHYSNIPIAERSGAKFSRAPFSNRNVYSVVSEAG